VILAFKSKALRRLCTDKEAAANKFGEASAKMLFACLADLRASEALADFPAFPSLMKFERQQRSIIVKYFDGPSITFVPNDRKAREPAIQSMGDLQYIRIDDVQF